MDNRSRQEQSRLPQGLPITTFVDSIRDFHQQQGNRMGERKWLRGSHLCIGKSTHLQSTPTYSRGNSTLPRRRSHLCRKYGSELDQLRLFVESIYGQQRWRSHPLVLTDGSPMRPERNFHLKHFGFKRRGVIEIRAMHSLSEKRWITLGHGEQ